MPIDRPSVRLVIIVLMACGKKATVVNIAAQKPIISGE